LIAGGSLQSAAFRRALATASARAPVRRCYGDAVGEVDQSIRIEPVAGRVAEAAAALAVCFAEEPGPRRSLPDPTTRVRVLRTILTASIRDAARHGLARVLIGTNDRGDQVVLGALLAMPPGSLPLSLRRRARKLPAMLRAAWLAPRSFPNYARSMLVRKATLPQPGDWWCLHTLGVHPPARQRDLVPRLMRYVLDLVDRDGLPSYLITSSAESIELYRQFGFVVHERVTEGPAGGYVTMCRPPAGR
jgi:ribosomal protein S18 acetylase RimI-like enzyme